MRAKHDVFASQNGPGGKNYRPVVTLLAMTGLFGADRLLAGVELP
jgi:hypothetical protein